MFNTTPLDGIHDHLAGDFDYEFSYGDDEQRRERLRPARPGAVKYHGGDSTREVAIARRERQIELLQNRILREQEKIDALRDIPTEPDALGAVVTFEKRFWSPNRGWSKAYTYAAVKADDDLWYTTGPKAPKGYTWDELVLWVREYEPVVIRVSTRSKEVK